MIPVKEKGEGSTELPLRHIGVSTARINQLLHPVSGILLHLRGHMVVNIQGESDGSMTRVL